MYVRVVAFGILGVLAGGCFPPSGDTNPSSGVSTTDPLKSSPEPAQAQKAPKTKQVTIAVSGFT